MQFEPDWKQYRFQDLLDEGILHLSDGYRAKNRELGGTGLIFLRAGHVQDSHISFDGVERFHSSLTDKLQSKVSVSGDTIVTTKGNSTGRTSFVSENMPCFVYSPHLSFWRSCDHGRLSPRFLRYWSMCQEFTEQLEGLKHQTDMAPYLSLKDQRRLRITLPPPLEQLAIARILGALDDKIELNRQMNATLEQMARALYSQWFNSVDDSSTELPTAAQLVESKVLVINDGYRAKRTELASDGLPFVRAGNLQDDGIDLTGAEFLSAKSVALSGNKISQPFDVAFTSKGTVGRMTLINEDTPRFVYAPQVCFWRVLNSEALNPHVLYRWMKSDDFFDQVDMVKGQTDMADYVSLTDQRRMHLNLPLGECQHRIGDKLARLHAQIAANGEENRKLAKTRDALLPQLLSGEIRLCQAKKQVEEVVA